MSFSTGLVLVLLGIIAIYISVQIYQWMTQRIKIILLSGYAGSGKDTAYEEFFFKRGYTRFAFVDMPKECASSRSNIPLRYFYDRSMKEKLCFKVKFDNNSYCDEVRIIDVNDTWYEPSKIARINSNDLIRENPCEIQRSGSSISTIANEKIMSPREYIIYFVERERKNDPDIFTRIVCEHINKYSGILHYLYTSIICLITFSKNKIPKYRHFVITDYRYPYQYLFMKKYFNVSPECTNQNKSLLRVSADITSIWISRLNVGKGNDNFNMSKSGCDFFVSNDSSKECLSNKLNQIMSIQMDDSN
jgi:hypothetical protein